MLKKWGLLLTLVAIGVGNFTARAGVSDSVLNVNLTNPGSAVSIVTFSVMSPGIGTKLSSFLAGTAGSPISVSSPAGQPNRLPTIGGPGSGADVQLSFIGKDIVGVTLIPLKVWSGNIQFVLTAYNTNQIRIVNSSVKVAWFNNATPPTALATGPRLPGFTVVTRDADYTAYNDLDTAFGIQNLIFFPDLTPSAFAALDLSSVLAAPPDPSLPSFTLSTSTSADFPGLPDPAPGDFFAAEGQILDPSSGLVIGAFADGVQTVVPEPSTLALLLAGLGSACAYFGSKRRR